jgi:hypothetical protein
MIIPQVFYNISKLQITFVKIYLTTGEGCHPSGMYEIIKWLLHNAYIPGLT